ncbi:chromosome segregation ATPase [Pseudozyma hubeiensis SY62]|uniref:Structural maintenance of chromosomes protein 4 n=1 Tax=Pseudozyma hubeiensis (strain SY62) TaxID=1305764 RepID=R9PB10_PSEHS|nr:chromosome segregation ATPase [Pseudozyma hubeiensis SY62]GAC95260.1 chromosome segregation ATPase [Pseudozyma hubeiensis SY62]DBA11446.1 TPA_inf: SMC4 [Pseudozyma hubeiensis]
MPPRRAAAAKARDSVASTASSGSSSSVSPTMHVKSTRSSRTSTATKSKSSKTATSSRSRGRIQDSEDEDDSEQDQQSEEEHEDEEEEDDDEDKEPDTPVKPASRSKAAAKTGAKPASRTSAARSRSVAKVTPPPTKPSKSRAKKVIESEDEDEDEEDQEQVDESLSLAHDQDDADDLPSPTALRRSKTAKASSMTKSKAAPVKQEEHSDEEQDLDSDGSELSFKEARSSTPEPKDAASSGSDVPQTPSSSLLKQIATPAKPAPPAGPLKRLVIHKMVLNDFKSYAGRQEIGPFHKSFSSVVGPNGSGKSNVIDSLLFVFGWRATKMRQGKLSELIHNSAGKENLPQCSVEVWFREIIDLPGDGFKVVPGSKLIVSRTAYRNNTSQYFINARKSTFTECTTLLKAKGIDLDHKRFLILQGEVESIAQMPPRAKNEHEEGLLEYLEDIIGTSCFKTPIEEQAKLVDEANEKRAEKLGRLKIVQKEKDALEAKKREAEQYLRDQNELARRHSALWQVYRLESRDNIKVATIAIEKYTAQLKQETEKHSGSRAEIQELESSYKALVKEFESIARSTEKVAKELAKYEKEDVQLQEKRKHLESKKKKLAKSIAEDRHAASEARATASDSAHKIEKEQAEVGKLEASLEREEAQLEKIRDSLKGKTEKFSRAIEQKQRELQPWTAKISDKTAAKNVAQEERDLLASRGAQVENSIAEAKEALRNLDIDNETKNDEVASLNQERRDLDKKTASCQKQLDEMKQQEAVLRSKVASARSKADEAKATVSACRSRGDVLSSLTRQADLGMIKGFHGRLGNLGVIDDKYDVAISTACPGLNNIVVDSVDCGQACIEHLRKNNLGRANFVLLNSLGISAAALQPIETPENVPRLFDLVKPRESRFAAAFYHQLRDTLVAKDLAHANRIAYGAKRWRVVTLDGQLIDKSGTMSGGGNKVSRGAMSSKFAADEVSPEQLQRMERDRDSLEDSLRGHIASIKTVESLLEGHRARAPQIEVALDKIRMDLESGEQRVTEAKRRVAELKAQSKPDADDASRIAELDAQIASLDKELAKLTEKSKAIEIDIESLQEKILEAGGVELRTQNSKVDSIKEKIELSSELTTKAEVAKSKAEKDVIKLEKSLEKNEAQCEELDGELEQLREQISSNSQAADAIRSKVEDAQHLMDSKAEERDEIKSQLDECSESANAFRALEMEIKQNLEDNERFRKEHEVQAKHLEEKLAGLTLHHVDGDDESDDEGDHEQANDEDDSQDGSVKRTKSSKKRSTGADADILEASPDELFEYPEDELREMDKIALQRAITVYGEKVDNGSANMSVLAEYRKREGEFLSRAKDLEATTQERDAAKQRYDDLRKQRLENFMAGFSVISSKLKEMYQTITLGGNAELELVDSLDPFAEGILFSVMPPKKSWKNISNLSGGEKTLSSLALVFALHAYKPTPVYVMDEIDAALDFRNVSIVANLIKERTKGGQFIIISLRNNMFELSSRLIGVYKTANCTKSLTIDNTELLAPPPAPAVAATPHSRPSMATIPGSPAATPLHRSQQAQMVAATPRPGGHGMYPPKTPSASASVNPGSSLNLQALMTPAIGKTPSSVLQRSRMHNSFASTNFLAEKAKGIKGPALGAAAGKRSVSQTLLETPTQATVQAQTQRG